MDFRWKIASRTGETYAGEDNFPTPELKENVDVFDLFLSRPCLIHPPHERSFIGKTISISVPEGMRLVFKRRCTFQMGGGCDPSDVKHQYIIAFEEKL